MGTRADFGQAVPVGKLLQALANVLELEVVDTKVIEV